MRGRLAILVALLAILAGRSLLAASEPTAVVPGPRPWTDYRVIMWIGDSAYEKPERLPVFWQRLREMGVNTAMVFGGRDPQPVWDSGFPYYVENIVNRGLCLKWNSPVRDWDKFVTGWAPTRSRTAFVRPYALDDPAWRDWAQGEVEAIARRHRDRQPLAYDLRDELSTTYSANPFDYDYAPVTLAAFRDWLRTRYPDLAALNAAWQTSFARWENVEPFTTDEIKNRMASGDAQPRGQPDWQALVRVQPPWAGDGAVTGTAAGARWNLAPWCDFRTYMDVALARALDDLRRAARAIDPATPVGIEGTQMPHAFGGYDLWRLSQAIDWVEPYDITGARAIFGSFMPGKPILSTIAATDTNHARRKLWHLLLEGDRGCIIWWSEDCLDWSRDDLPLTAKGRALAPALADLTSPLARLFVRAEREFDPVMLLYSQPSIQVDWLVESIEDGRTWHRRFSSYEAQHNRQAVRRAALLRELRGAGFSPRFVASAQVEAGELARQGCRALVLQDAYALSDREAAQIRAWRQQQGCRLVIDGPAGWFDEHGRLRPRPLFDVQGSGSAPSPVVPRPRDAGLSRDGERQAGPDDGSASPPRGRGRPRVVSGPGLRHAEVASATQAGEGETTSLTDGLGLRPAVRVEPAAAAVAVYRYKIGPARLLAFERNLNWHGGEDLKEGGGNESLEQPVAVHAAWDGAAHVYDLRRGAYLGRVGEIQFTLDPWQPSLFALLPNRLPDGADPVRIGVNREYLPASREWAGTRMDTERGRERAGTGGAVGKMFGPIAHCGAGQTACLCGEARPRHA